MVVELPELTVAESLLAVGASFVVSLLVETLIATVATFDRAPSSSATE
jgi:hypothetical protein